MIRSRVNLQLDELRQKYHALPEFLSKEVQEVASRITSPNITTVNVVYFPQLGFLVTIPLDGGAAASSLSLPSDFVLQFSTEKVAYFKDPATRKLDDDVGDVYAEMVDLEIEILQVVATQIEPLKGRLLLLAGISAELDCLASLAEFCLENRLVRPVLTNGTELEIVNGRCFAARCRIA